MARGFWTGMGHGTVLSGAVLVLMSLLWPLPAPVETPAAAIPAPEAFSRDAAPAAAEPSEVAPVAALGGTGDARQAPRPDAGAIDLPVGSEFGRGGDVVPRLPEPLSAPQARLDMTDAPAVSAPAAEPAPVTVTGDDARPQAVLTEPAPQSPAEGEATPRFARPDFTRLPGSDARQSGAAPGMAALAVPDLLPGAVPPADQPAGPTVDSLAGGSPEVSAAPQAPASEVVRAAPARTPPTVVVTPAPRLPSPALDLSLPPDLSDLRGLGRN